jgi:hypothetical protein
MWFSLAAAQNHKEAIENRGYSRRSKDHRPGRRSALILPRARTCNRCQPIRARCDGANARVHLSAGTAGHVSARTDNTHSCRTLRRDRRRHGEERVRG